VTSSENVKEGAEADKYSCFRFDCKRPLLASAILIMTVIEVKYIFQNIRLIFSSS